MNTHAFPILIVLSIMLASLACSSEATPTSSPQATLPAQDRPTPQSVPTVSVQPPKPTSTVAATPVATPTLISAIAAVPTRTSAVDISYDRRTPFVPLDNPALLSSQVADYLSDDDLVLGLEWENESHAYPVRMIRFHHIVNDTVAGRPFLITYWIKCSSGVGFDPVVDGRHLTFEVFGLLGGVLTIVDRETDSIWTHLDGKAIKGQLQGARMTMVPLIHITWDEWKASHPDTMVLSPDTPFRDRYRPVSIGVFNQREAEFGDGRLAANALVIGVEIEGQFKGYPLEEIQSLGGVVNDTLAGQPIVVIYDDIAQVGLAYSRVSGDLILEYYDSGIDGFELRDKETDSVWDHQGRALSGSLAGTSLEFIPSFISEWYGWSGYHPETALFEGAP